MKEIQATSEIYINIIQNILIYASISNCPNLVLYRYDTGK